VHGHSEQPTRRAILADITCDSDGKIDRFIESGGLRPRCRAPVLKASLTIRLFLVAPIRKPGDLHNLMGDTTWRACAPSRRQLRVRTRNERRQHSDLLSYVDTSAEAARAAAPHGGAGGAQRAHHAGAARRPCWSQRILAVTGLGLDRKTAGWRIPARSVALRQRDALVRTACSAVRRSCSSSFCGWY